MKKLLLALLAALLVLAGVIGVRTARMASTQLQVDPVSPLSLDSGEAAGRLSGALKIATVSDPLKGPDPAALQTLRDYLQRNFPDAHRTLRRELVGGGSLLYTWTGRHPELEPVALLAHLDVVPADGTWQVPPFEGRVQDGFIWGRGAIDDKGAVVAILEAVEVLVRQGFTPERTVILAFGQDEEIGGAHGAKAIAGLLAARGVRLRSVLDEGEVIGDGLVPGVAAPVALIGVAEKGYMSVRLEVDGAGGHSSMPTHPGTVAILAEALARLEAHPFPIRNGEATDRMFEVLAPDMEGMGKVAFANRLLFDPLIRRQMAASPSADALQRTTLAFTQLEGSPKENVLPTRAAAVVNLRLLPGDSVASAMAGLRARVDDPRVRLVPLMDRALEPSAITSSLDGDYELLARTVRQIFPRALVAPSLVLGGTDSTHYRALTSRIYRFLPVPATTEDLGRFHGPNERIRVEDHLNAIRFYVQYLRNTAN